MTRAELIRAFDELSIEDNDEVLFLDITNAEIYEVCAIGSAFPVIRPMLKEKK